MATFHFAHEWALPADVERVYAALSDIERYAVWWPEVRSVTRVDDESGWTTVRSLLPYTLDLLLRRDVEDPDALRLRVAVEGDLRGWCQWRLERSDRGGTTAHFSQEVDVAPGLLRWGSRVARPLFVANHTHMMRSGERGLTVYLVPVG